MRCGISTRSDYSLIILVMLAKIYIAIIIKRLRVKNRSKESECNTETEVLLLASLVFTVVLFIQSILLFLTNN
jgi:hypothetical protein